MPTQQQSRSVAKLILGPSPGFRQGPPQNPVSRGLPAGTVTDDTLQSLLVARLLVEGKGRIDPIRLAAGGITNGKAMRVSPVGIATPPLPFDRLVEAVAGAGMVSHDAGAANAGAAAVAMAVSCGVAGLSFDEALGPAIEAAVRGAALGQAFNDDRLSWLILRATGLAGSLAVDRTAALDTLAEEIGTGVAVDQSVPAAFAVAALAPNDAWQAAVLGAGLGGDSDTIASIAAAMVGACTGLAALPADAVATVRRVNRLDLEPLAEQLLELRRRA